MTNYPVANEQTSGDLPLRAALFTIFLCTLFGANAVAIKLSFTGFGVFTTVCLRFFLATTVILIFARLRSIPLMLASTTQFIQIALISLIFFLQMSGIYVGQSLTSASHGTLIANLQPFFVMILAHFFLYDDAISLRKTAGLLLGFSGIALLFFDSATTQQSSVAGDTIILGAIILWACNVILIKRIIAGFHPIQITLFPMILSLPLFFLAALMFDEQKIVTLSLTAIMALIYQGVVTASFGFIMWNSLIKKYGATSLHSFLFVVPISGVFFGVLLLGEPFSPRLFASIVCVSAGLLIIHFRRTASLPSNPP